MKWRKTSRATVVLVSAAMVLVGCSSSKKTPVSSTNTTASSSGGTSSGSGSSGGANGGVIPKPSGAKYGQDATNKNLYTGAGGFQVDTTKCPSDWNNTQGITDSQISLFASIPKSGPFAGFGLLGDGITSYFNYVNDHGGIGGRKITMDFKDDTYKPDLTKTNVDEALQTKKYAAMPMVLGTPNNLAIWDEMNRECMPELLAATGAPQWGDVNGHPWTTGMQLDYYTEARLWALWLKSKFPKGAKVAAITFNSDFGNSYVKGFKSAIKGTNLTLVGNFPHDPTAPNLDNQYTSAAATNADVLLLQTSAVYCTQGMADVEKGSWKPTVVMSGTCGSLGQFFQPLINQGLTGKGTYLIQNYIDVNDPSHANEPIVQAYKEQLGKQGLDPSKTTYFTGWIFGWYMTEFLQDASSFKGGLNRANIMLAARSATQTNPILIKGLTSKMNGLKDAYMTEGGQMVQYQVTDPKKLGSFVPVGDLLNLEGQLGTFDTVKNAQA